MSLEEGHTRLCKHGQPNWLEWYHVDSSLSHNSSYTVVVHLTGTMHLKVHLFQCETCIIGFV